MPDALGWRMKFGVIAPSTNTIVQPEFDAMRPAGVTNHFGRIHIPNDPLTNDDDFVRLIDTVRREIMSAVDRVMTCEPDHLIMGMSSETFWKGKGITRHPRQVEGPTLSMAPNDNATEPSQRRGVSFAGLGRATAR